MKRRARAARGGAGRVGVALALALGLALGAVGCRRATPGGEQSTPAGGASTRPGASAGAGGTSGALVASPHHDFGHVTQNDTLKHSFAAHNGTSDVLTVDDALEVLGCSAVTVPSVIEAGHDARVEVTCRATTPGPLRVSLPLRANGRPAGQLLLAGEVEPLLAFDRSVVELTVPYGERRSLAVHLRGKRAMDARLTPEAFPPYIDAGVLRELATPEGVVVRALGNGVGTHVGSLRFVTGLPEPREVSLSYVVKILGTLTVSPTNPIVQLGGKGPSRVVVKVTSTQPGFAVSGAEITQGPFAARVHRAKDGFDVEITALEAKIPPGVRGVNGSVRILSNDRAEGTKEVPLFVLGAPFGPR